MRFRFDRLTPTGLIRFVAEAVLLFLVVWAPWPFASVEYAWEAILIGGTVLLAMLWIAHGMFQGDLVIRPDGVFYGLLGLVLLTAIQLMPLPGSIVGTLSPSRLQLHEQLLPPSFEILPGEAAPEARSSTLSLTPDPFLTRVFLAQSLSLALLYLVVRSWLASRESLRRLAWVCTINGILLALVGIAQFFSSPPNVVYWRVITDGAVFGPFVCKNHYPDYVLFCLGLGIGLLVSRQGPKAVKIKGVEYHMNFVGRITESPDVVVLTCGLTLVVMSIPFSLSRGGILATAVAAASVGVVVYRARGKLTKGILFTGVLLLLALLLGGWFGWDAVTQRLGTLVSGQAGQVRSTLWGDVSRLIPGYLAAGGGNGAFQRFEMTTRSENEPANYHLDNAHNEYLEAILEGGIVRLALTLWIIYCATRTTLQAYLKLRDRSSGPLLLGILFGLVGLAVHSFVDFGIHMPAVALIAAMMAAYAADAATDPTYIPFKKKSLDMPKPDPGRRHLKGLPLIAVSVVVAALSLWLIVDSSRRGQAEELKIVARDALKNGTLDLHRIRLEVLTAATARTPTDVTAWAMLAAAHLDAADDERRTGAMALGGVTAIYPMANANFTATEGEHVRAGLAAARTARSCCPLAPIPHVLIGQNVAGFAKSEPAKAHFDRAIRICPGDPNLYILRGSDAASRGDTAAAITDWKKAMTLNPLKVPEVLVVAQKLSPDQILSQLLPENPLIIWKSVEQLRPLWKDPHGRAPFLERIVSLDHVQDWPSHDWAAIARAYIELGRYDQASHAWRKAIAKEPDAFDLHNEYSLWLEAEERYPEADEQLQWLRNTRDSRELMDRQDAVRHAIDLQKRIEGR